jgi:hypothetical protein
MTATLRPKSGGVSGAPMSRSEQEADEGEKVLMVREKEKGGREKRASVGRWWQGAPIQGRWDTDAWARPLCVGLNRFKLEFKQI